LDAGIAPVELLALSSDVGACVRRVSVCARGFDLFSVFENGVEVLGYDGCAVGGRMFGDGYVDYLTFSLVVESQVEEVPVGLD
jgi:hypothetical protein